MKEDSVHEELIGTRWARRGEILRITGASKYGRIYGVFERSPTREGLQSHFFDREALDKGGWFMVKQTNPDMVANMATENARAQYFGSMEALAARKQFIAQGFGVSVEVEIPEDTVYQKFRDLQAANRTPEQIEAVKERVARELAEPAKCEPTCTPAAPCMSAVCPQRREDECEKSEWAYLHMGWRANALCPWWRLADAPAKPRMPDLRCAQEWACGLVRTRR